MQLSDLKGGGSQSAQLYSVSTVPETVLVNSDGIIIAKGFLPGAQSSKKLKKIFGE